MTSETRTYIDFSDIAGVEVTCHECQTSTTRTLERFVDGTCVCPNCETPLLPYNQTDARTLLNFANALRFVQGLKPAARIRLNIKTLSSQTSAGQQ